MPQRPQAHGRGFQPDPARTVPSGESKLTHGLRGQHPEPGVTLTAVAPHCGQLRGRVEHQLLGLASHLGDEQNPGAGWRLVQVGQSAGAEATLASAVIRGKMGEVYGYNDFSVPKDQFREQYLRLVSHATAGEIVFDIETYPFERVADAWERQAKGAHAKLVVTLT